MSIAAPVREMDVDLDAAEQVRPDKPWQLLVWDDPVNLMTYVVHVFRQYFGYSLEKATALMLLVHNSGHAIVAEGPRELMEQHASAMHDHGLWATVRQDPS